MATATKAGITKRIPVSTPLLERAYARRDQKRRGQPIQLSKARKISAARPAQISAALSYRQALKSTSRRSRRAAPSVFFKSAQPAFSPSATPPLHYPLPAY